MKFKLKPVAWATGLLSALSILLALNDVYNVVPERWQPYLLTAVAILTAFLGKAVHNRTTPVAAPKDDAGVPLVPIRR